MGFMLLESSSVSMCLLVSLHDSFMELLVGVLSFVVFCVVLSLSFKGVCSKIENSHFIEFFWTVVPIVMIFGMALPSFLVAYSLDDVPSKPFTVSVKGMQWNWEVKFFSDSWGGARSEVGEMESYSLLPVLDGVSSFRSLESESSVVVPCGKPVVFELSSDDVIHSFTVPCLGFKLDCIPGKSAEVYTLILKAGVFHGHCAEICGANHSMMPFDLVSV